MRDPVPAPAVAGVLVAAAVAPFVAPAMAAPGVGVLVLVLAGLALVPLLGWLRTVFLGGPASAGVAMIVATRLMAAEQSPIVAFVVAGAVGAAVAVVMLLPVWRHPHSGLPWSSLLATVVVWGVVAPRWPAEAFRAPAVFGYALERPRAVYLLALALAAVAVAAVRNLARARVGLEAGVYGAAPALARRSGVHPGAMWLRLTALGGAVAGVAGVLLALVEQVPLAPAAFSPVVALTWLAVPMVGGTRVASGPVVGAVAVGLLLPAAALPPAAAGVLALAAAAVVARDGALAPVPGRHTARPRTP